MRRVHLFELEDQPWVPSRIRDGSTDLLDVFFARLNVYGGVASRLEAVLQAAGTHDIVDLCSGGGGGTLALVRQLLARGGDVRATFTDRFPNAAARARVAAIGDARLAYLASPMDVRDGGGALPGVRTCAGALHHFRPGQVREILAAVVARGEPLAFFDVAASPALRRLPWMLAPVALGLNMAALTVVAAVTTVVIRPLRWERWLLTFGLPLIPLLFAWDGTVSALRAYTPEELLQLAREVPGADGYEWHAVQDGLALCLTGIPAAAVSRRSRTGASSWPAP